MVLSRAMHTRSCRPMAMMVDVAHVLSKCAILGAMMPSGLEIGLMTASLVVQGGFPFEFYGKKIKEGSIWLVPWKVSKFGILRKT